MKIAALLLAAGGSTRMGSLKQTLPVEGLPMVRRVASRLIATPIARLVVVTGNQDAIVEESLQGLKLDICRNADWEKGIGSSISCGVQSIQNRLVDIDAVLIALADQPMVEASHFIRLIDAMKSANQIVASLYEDKPGVPVIFGRDYFPELCAINHSSGANRIIQGHHQNVHAIPLNDHFDIDTPTDYSKLSRG